MTLTRKKAEGLILWLLKRASSIRYGEIAIKVILHDGQIREIRRIVDEEDRGE